jgi:UDP-GlcNAc:undecaprenyl-phosphate/decaprenyl-phosphate GlcNAc-1-phosphate transferase
VGEALRVGLALALSALLTSATVPLAIAIAGRTGFLDSPQGYKSHLRPTPYLGGAGVLAAALPVAMLLGGDLLSLYWPLLAGAVVLAAVGALDDRVNLSPWLRLALEAGAGWFLWSQDLGWSFLGSDLLNLALTAIWVMALVNAFNLMDNMDGAAATVASVSCASIAVLAVIGDDVPLAVLGTALCGALLGFLRFNLAKPARVFLGDGGSMPIGFLIAGSLMSVPMGEASGWGTVAAAALIAGLPIFDTTLVVISRRRRGVQVLSGATDHTTHRLRGLLGTPHAVAAALALVQACLGALAIEGTRLGNPALAAIATFALLLAAATIVIVESPGWMPVSDDS